MSKHQPIELGSPASYRPGTREGELARGNSRSDQLTRFVAPAKVGDEELRMFECAIDELPDQVAITDEFWNILCTNTSWCTFIHLVGRPELVPGENYLSCARLYAAQGSQSSQIMLDGIVAMDRSQQTQFSMTHRLATPSGARDLKVLVSRFSVGKNNYAIVTRHDVTEFLELREKCWQSASTILKAQEDERRRIGRELHDSTSQLLVGIQFDLLRLRKLGYNPAQDAIIAEINGRLSCVHEELRATSYLLHPPSLSNVSLRDALEDLTTGFGKRSGLETSYYAEVGIGVSAKQNKTLYRIAQEALANVHRHAKATNVVVWLKRGISCIHLVIVDDGCGVQDAARLHAKSGKLGVGIRGMRERANDLGGRLSIRDSFPGTCVIASLPMIERCSTGGEFPSRLRAALRLIPDGSDLSKIMPLP